MLNFKVSLVWITRNWLAEIFKTSKQITEKKREENTIEFELHKTQSFQVLGASVNMFVDNKKIILKKILTCTTD